MPINSVLWIAVVILLEAEVRFPELVSKARHAFAATAALLYGGLAVLVVLWAVNGLWFDAYDALLWLIAFATLELSIVENTASALPTAVCALKSRDEAFEIALRQIVDPARGFTSAAALEPLAQRARAAWPLGGRAHAHHEARTPGDEDGMRPPRMRLREPIPEESVHPAAQAASGSMYTAAESVAECGSISCARYRSSAYAFFSTLKTGSSKMKCRGSW